MVAMSWKRKTLVEEIAMALQRAIRPGQRSGQHDRYTDVRELSPISAPVGQAPESGTIVRLVRVSLANMRYT